MVTAEVTPQKAVRRRRTTTAVIASAALATIALSNIALHRSIDASAGENWAAIQRLDNPSSTASLTIRQRYGMFFALRDIISDRTVLEIPTTWRGSVQERQFEEFFSPVLAGVSQVARVDAVDSVPYGTADDWFEPTMKALRKEGYTVAEGRSRATGRQPWYQWRIIAASENPPVLQVLASPENNFVLVDPRIRSVP